MLEKRKILITGATGFLGAHITGELVLKGNCDLVCLVRGNSFEDAKKKIIFIFRFLL